MAIALYGLGRMSFNPRPSRKRGATRGRDLPVQTPDRVSILAPLARGALLPIAIC